MKRTKHQKPKSIEYRDPLLELAEQVSLERATVKQAEKSGSVPKATLNTMHRVVGYASGIWSSPGRRGGRS